MAKDFPFVDRSRRLSYLRRTPALAALVIQERLHRDPARSIHDALVKPMPAGPTTAGLAESWTASPDGTTYEFLLRAGAKFHDGSPVTSEGAKFTFERYRGGAAALLKEKVKEVRIVDARRVRFVLKEAWPDFITWENALIRASGPRIEESALTLIPSYPYSAPYEELRLKAR